MFVKAISLLSGRFGSVGSIATGAKQRNARGGPATGYRKSTKRRRTLRRSGWHSGPCRAGAPRARIASLENGIAYWRTAGVAGNDALEAGWRTHTLREEQTGGARERARAVDDLVDLEEAAFRGVEDALVMNREGTIRRGDDQIPLILAQVVRITGLEVQQSESRGPPASTAQKTARFARGSGIARCCARPSGVARSPSGRP